MLSIKPSSLHVQIMRELVNNGIEIYQFPVDDETFAENNARMNVSVDMYTQTCAHTTVHIHSIHPIFFNLQEQLPFAVVGSRDEMVVGGQKVRARIYPWGTVEVENECECTASDAPPSVVPVTV